MHKINLAASNLSTRPQTRSGCTIAYCLCVQFPWKPCAFDSDFREAMCNGLIRQKTKETGPEGLLVCISFRETEMQGHEKTLRLAQTFECNHGMRAELISCDGL